MPSPSMWSMASAAEAAPRQAPIATTPPPAAVAIPTTPATPPEPTPPAPGDIPGVSGMPRVSTTPTELKGPVEPAIPTNHRPKSVLRVQSVPAISATKPQDAWSNFNSTLGNSSGGPALAPQTSTASTKYQVAWDNFKRDYVNVETEKEDHPVMKEMRDYADISSIVGLRFCTEKNRPIWENLLWIALMITSIGLCIYFIKPSYDDWHDKPTITSIYKTNYPVWNIDFPAVTMCSNNRIVDAQLKSAMSRTPPFNEWIGSLQSQQLHDYFEIVKELLTLYFQFRYLDTDSFNALGDDVKQNFDNFKDDFPKLLPQVSPNCKTIGFYCSWKGAVKDCRDYLDIRRTDMGFCCSFNAAQISDLFGETLDQADQNSTDNWWDDYGFYTTSTEANTEASTDPSDETASDSGRRKRDAVTSTTTTTTTISTTKTAKVPPASSSTSNTGLPQMERTNSASSTLGFSILLNVSSGDYIKPLNDFLGFKVLVHDPNVFPEVDAKGFSVGVGTVNYVSVDAHTIFSTDDVFDMPFSRRQCLSPLDKDLKDLASQGLVESLTVFQNYTESNCILECRAQKIYALCGCLPYYYPDFGKQWNKTTTCNISALSCLAHNSDIFYALNPYNGNMTAVGLSEGLVCTCPMDCNTTTYRSDVSQGPFDKLNGQVWDQLLNNDSEFRARFPEGLSDDELYAKVEIAKNDSAYLHVFFKEIGIIQYQRDQRASTIDLIGNWGGIVGLFNGFCMLTLCEIVYWFTARLFWNMHKSKKERNRAIPNAGNEEEPPPAYNYMVAKDAEKDQQF